jgi:hypothetical protein
VHLDDVRHVCLDFFAVRKIFLGASVVFDYISTVTFTGNILCGGRRREHSFEGLLNSEILLKDLGMTNLK